MQNAQQQSQILRTSPSLSKSNNTTSVMSLRQKLTMYYFSVPATKEDIHTLWVKLTMAFGHKFVSQHGNQDNGVWWEALSDLTRAEIEEGFTKMLRDTGNVKPGETIWPPNVKEFRAYCVSRLSDFGLPANWEAYNQACGAKYSGVLHGDHPAVYQSAAWVGYERLTNTWIEQTVQQDFYRVYDILCFAVMRGLELPLTKSVVWEKERLLDPLANLTEEAVHEAVINVALQNHLKRKTTNENTTAIK